MMTVSSILPTVKQALRLSTTDFDTLELTNLIISAQKDLGIAGVIVPDNYDDLVLQAIITYCKFHFGIVDDYDRLKLSYDEQKAQLMTATGYTNWGGNNV